MAVERRKAYVDYASKSVLRVNTPYRKKEFDVDSLASFNIGNLAGVGDIIDLAKLTVQKSDVNPVPELFAYVMVIDPQDSFRGKVISVAVKTAQGRYNLLSSISLGTAQAFDVKVVV